MGKNIRVTVFRYVSPYSVVIFTNVSEEPIASVCKRPLLDRNILCALLFTPIDSLMLLRAIHGPLGGHDSQFERP
jgi:hypothetical protein